MLSFLAEPGVDFNFTLSAQVVFPAMTSGTSTQCTPVDIIDDDDYEGEQTFNVSFSLETTLPVVITNGEAVVIIIDNGG